MPPQADVMLVKNAQNLMQAVKKTVKAAEAACMKVCIYKEPRAICVHILSIDILYITGC